jgi:hypothetical protein
MASLTEMAAKAVGKRTPGDEEKEPPKKLIPPKIPPKEVTKRLDRGRERLKQVQARRKQAIEFVNGNHYVFITEDRLQVNQTSTVAISDGGLMPDHRVRRSHDLLGPIIKRKISTAVQRIPGYEVIQSDETEQAFLAAQIAEKVLYAGYDKWEVKRAMKKLIWNALVTEEGFIGSRWDSSVGPYVDVSRHPEGEHPWSRTRTGSRSSTPTTASLTPRNRNTSAWGRSSWWSSVGSRSSPNRGSSSRSPGGSGSRPPSPSRWSKKNPTSSTTGKS